MGRRSDPEVRARAVRLMAAHRKDYATFTEALEAVARQVGMSRETVRRWVTQDEVDTGVREGVTTVDQERIRQLEKENRRLREDNAILKAASVFFAGELDPRNR
jgi:transposase-like protein